MGKFYKYDKLTRSTFIVVAGNLTRKRVHTTYCKDMDEVNEALKVMGRLCSEEDIHVFEKHVPNLALKALIEEYNIAIKSNYFKE